MDEIRIFKIHSNSNKRKWIIISTYLYSIYKINSAVKSFDRKPFLKSIYFSLQDVTDKVVLITGGGGGVGANLAKNFAELNAKVIIWDINRDGNILYFYYNYILFSIRHITIENFNNYICIQF